MKGISFTPSGTVGCERARRSTAPSAGLGPSRSGGISMGLLSTIDNYPGVLAEAVVVVQIAAHQRKVNATENTREPVGKQAPGFGWYRCAITNIKAAYARTCPQGKEGLIRFFRNSNCEFATWRRRAAA